MDTNWKETNTMPHPDVPAEYAIGILSHMKQAVIKTLEKYYGGILRWEYIPSWGNCPIVVSTFQSLSGESVCFGDNWGYCFSILKKVQ